jgi:hypothetical protein
MSAKRPKHQNQKTTKGEKQEMTDTSLKAALSFDETTNTFNPAGHNLSAEKAEEKARTIEGQGRKAKVLDQPSRHKGRSFKTCTACKNAAENLSQQQRDTSLEEHSEELPIVAEGGQEG